MVNLNKIYNPYMYNYYDDSIQYKKTLQPRRVNKEINFFKVKRDWCDSVRKTGYFIEIEASSESLVTRSRMKAENLPFLESVARQFSSLPIFVDCNKVRKHFEYILYAWMEAFQVCKCKSTADGMCDFTPVSARRSFELFAINVK